MGVERCGQHNGYTLIMYVRVRWCVHVHVLSNFVRGAKVGELRFCPFGATNQYFVFVCRYINSTEQHPTDWDLEPRCCVAVVVLRCLLRSPCGCNDSRSVSPNVCVCMCVCPCGLCAACMLRN